MAQDTTPAPALWSCPRCGRSFTRVNQRHACGASESSDVTRNRPESVVRTWIALERFARSLGPVEVVARDHTVLLRSVRIFADLVLQTDAVRLAIHLKRRVDDPRFFKIVADRRHTTHVVRLEGESEVAAVRAYLAEAYAASLEPPADTRGRGG